MGLSLNPQLEVLRDPTSPSEAVNWLVNRKNDQDIGIRNESNRDELKEWGYSSQKIQGLMKKAEEVVKKGKALFKYYKHTTQS